MRTLCIALLALCAVVGASNADAHQGTNSYLTLTAGEAEMQVRSDVAVRDLAMVLALDENDDGDVTWREVRDLEPAIIQYLDEHITLGDGAAPCLLENPRLALAARDDITYVSVLFDTPCHLAATAKLDYGVLFAQDASHRGFVTVHDRHSSIRRVLSPRHRVWSLADNVTKTDSQARFMRFFHQGILHIVTGFDHMLFLVTLLLPALVRHRADTTATAAMRRAAWPMIGIISVFTLAHGLTLILVVSNAISVNLNWVEPIIALSICGAALNKVYGFISRRLAWFAFVLGLVHGLGFAEGLRDVGLPSDGLAIALLGFNLGIEAGQLLVLACVVPLVFLIGRRQRQWHWLRAASFVIALGGGGWFVQRVGALALS